MTHENKEHVRKNPFRQYLIIGITLLLFGTGVSLLLRSCKPKQHAAVTEPTEEPDLSEENIPDDETLNEIIETQDKDLVTSGEEDSADEEEAGDFPVKEEESDETANPSPGANVLNDAPANTSGQYMVIAGSFASRANARKRLEKVILKGFTEAEIVQFDDSDFNTVCALRTDSEEEARRAVQKLKAKGINAFVHKKK